MKILIVGGYGTFGGRIVALLEDDPRLILVIAGRSLAKARAFCAGRHAKSVLVPAAFDRRGDVSAVLAQYRPDMLVDASGPFQAYGEGRYRIVEACIAAGVNYLDLADGSDFVAGIGAFDAAAQAAGLTVLSGVSSFPVLTAAVVRVLATGMARVTTIQGGIAPSPYAGVGLNVIRAIAHYAGQPIALIRAGRAATGFPLTETMRYTIAPPGSVPLRNTLFSLVDVPDLRALAELWPEADSIWMGAGPVPEILHRALIALAWLVRLKLLKSLTALAPLMHLVTNTLRWGEHRGGMFIVVTGTDAAGAAVQRSWHLLAEGDDGPLIPAMAVAALVRRELENDRPLPGARAAVFRDLELSHYEKLFGGRRITTGFRDDRPGPAPLFQRLLGPAWDRVPAEIRALHEAAGSIVAEGRASVTRGRGLLSRLAARLVRFPAAASDTPVAVRFDSVDGAEIWTRRFGDDIFHSRLFAGRGRSQALLCERFGPVVFAMALVPSGDSLKLTIRHWHLFGVRMPMPLCPRSNSYESAEDGKFHFHVEIGHPLTGLIVRYWGWLAITPAIPGEIPAAASACGSPAPPALPAP